MKEEKLGQEPAFPTTLNQVVGQTTYNFTDENGKEQIGYYNNYADISYQGVSKRVYAACSAMQGDVSALNEVSLQARGFTFDVETRNDKRIL